MWFSIGIVCLGHISFLMLDCYLRLINSRLFEELSIIVPIYKKDDKIDCSNYRGIQLLPTTYIILFNIFISKLTPYAEEIIGDQHYEFRRGRSTTDHIFCICKILD